jgi:hypothetical protein
LFGQSLADTEIYKTIELYFGLISEFITGVAIVATIGVQIIGRFINISDFNKKLLYIIHFLPTFGRNPLTEQLAKEVEKLKAQQITKISNDVIGENLTVEQVKNQIKL